MDAKTVGPLTGYDRLIVSFATIAAMDQRTQQTTFDFIEQLHHTNDPEAFATFVRWRECHGLEVLMLLASKLTDDELDEAISVVEDIVKAQACAANACPVCGVALPVESHADEG